MADGSVFDVDPEIWHEEIPGTPVLRYFTDWDPRVIVPVD